MVEGARLESEYTSKAYRGFESLPLRQHILRTRSHLCAFSPYHRPLPRATGAVCIHRRTSVRPLPWCNPWHRPSRSMVSRKGGRQREQSSTGDRIAASARKTDSCRKALEMNFLKAALLASIILFDQACFAKGILVNNDATGICFRRLAALNSEHAVIDRFEVVIIKSSSSLSRDIARVESISHEGSPLRNPDMKPFIWIPALITDSEYTEITNLDCSKLPVIGPQRQQRAGKH